MVALEEDDVQDVLLSVMGDSCPAALHWKALPVVACWQPALLLYSLRPASYATIEG